MADVQISFSRFNQEVNGPNGVVARWLRRSEPLYRRTAKEVTRERVDRSSPEKFRQRQKHDGRDAHYIDSFVTQVRIDGVKPVLSIGNTAPHAMVLEFGSGAHDIVAQNLDDEARSGRAMLAFWWARRSTYFVGPRVFHPGTRPYTILLDSSKRATLRAIKLSA